MLKFLIADDHAVVREGVKRILREEFPQADFGEAQNAVQVLQQVRDRHWDMIMLDISLPSRSGLEVLKELKSLNPKLPVLILSIHPEELYAVRALRSGAAGYMTKDCVPEELRDAVRKVLSGGKYISESLAERLVYELGVDAERAPHERLSDREYEVMLMISSGKKVFEIAQILQLSPKTISTYRARILQKMNMKSNAQLTHYAIQNRLLE